MDKRQILNLIIEQLSQDLSVQYNAALTAHEASTHEENIPDNKYETLALEASYLAQGQANRAMEIKRALESYKQLILNEFDDNTPIALSALVKLVSQNSESKTIFIGPREGGMKVFYEPAETEIMVITPASPLGKILMGKCTGEVIGLGMGVAYKEFEIISVS